MLNSIKESVLFGFVVVVWLVWLVGCFFLVFFFGWVFFWSLLKLLQLSKN